MNRTAGGPTHTEETESDLPDVTGMPFADVAAPSSAVLDNAVRRVLADLDSQAAVVAGFSNRV
jgi:hypothetical protein